MRAFFGALALALSVTACGAAESRSLHAAQRLESDDGDAFSEIPWETVSGESLEYGLRFAWTDTQLRVGIKLSQEALEGGNYFHFCLDLENDSTFSYQEDDYHFSVSLPDEKGDIALSLSKSGGEAVDPNKVIQARSLRTGEGWEVDLTVELLELRDVSLAEGSDIGMLLELKESPGPNPLPIHWGDLLLGDAKGQVSKKVLAGMRNHQAQQEELYLDHQTDPEAPRHLSEETRRDLERVRERIVIAQERELDRAELQELVDSQRKDGSWDDIRYYKDGVPDMEGCWEHMNRLVTLAVGVRFAALENSGRTALYRGLDYWIDHDFVFTNWWRNEIGVPLQLGRIALLDDALSEAKELWIVDVMKRARRPMTGQNLVWINKITAMRGVLEGNPALVERAFERIEETICVSGGEGIQADYSFHQHGALLYSHGYGAEFANDATQTYYWSQGGQFEMSRETLHLLENLVLEGNRWMARGAFADFGALGRNVVRPESNARYLQRVAETLLEADAERKEELKDLIASLNGASRDALSGNRYFHRSEFMVQRRPEFYASVNVYSKRMSGTEYLNGEGIKSYYLPDGTTLFLRRGDEYEGILPIWDWRKIPGATIPVSEEAIPIFGFRRASSKGNTDFAGGVSDGWLGCVGYDYQKDGVSARKAYFGFDWGLVCLGADIRSASGEALLTTVNQTRLSGEVRVGNATGEIGLLGQGSRRLEGSTQWVTHDGFLYYFPVEQEIEVAAQVQRGSWRELSRRESDAPLSGEVFTVSVKHDDPESGTYAYGVIATERIQSPETFMAAPCFSVLKNSAAIQAVADADSGVFQCVFYEAGQVDLGNGFSVAVDRRCALILREEGQGVYKATLASPAREAGEVVVTLANASADEQQSVAIALPAGLHWAGSSVSETIVSKPR